MKKRVFHSLVTAATLLAAAIVFSLPVAAHYEESNPDTSLTYSQMQERALASNPLELIASTVREDSAVYPRPTALALFLDPVFAPVGVRAASMVEELLLNPEYADIHHFKTSNGAPYLYSDRFLTEEAAVAAAEWIEVGSRLPANQ